MHQNGFANATLSAFLQFARLGLVLTFAYQSWAEENIAKTPSNAQVLLTEARRQLANMKSSHYQHKTQVDESKGEFNYDCSGFIDYSLKRVLPKAYQALPISTSKRPLAQDFYYHIHSQGQNPGAGGWMQVKNSSELVPGDIVVWLKPEDSDSNNTGHVMVVFSKPEINPNRPDEVLVKVVDSTKSPHADDSRSDDETGLGTGTIGLIVDHEGKALRYRWKGGVSKKEVDTQIAFGHIEKGERS